MIDINLAKCIKITKRRILHAEKHGMGTMAMREKAKLKIQERKRELKDQ